MASTLRFLVNPTAGGGRARRVLDRVRARAEVEGATVELSTDGPDLTARAGRALEEGLRRLIVVGGDGTAHLAIQALAESPCELAVVPTGRGDDFALSLGVPADLEGALELAVSGAARRVDLIRIERPDGPTWGGIYASLGFDSAVTRIANAQPRWIPRRVTYLLAALRVLARFHAPRVTVDHDGGRYAGRAMLVTACNAPRYGGGMRIAPEARMDDGRFDLVTVDELPKRTALWLLLKVLDGRHVGHPAVSIFRGRSTRIEVEPGVLLGCDGEIVGRVAGEPVELSIVPSALAVVRTAV